MHPHGVLSLHAWCSFCTEACGFSELYPGIDLHVGKPRHWMQVSHMYGCHLMLQLQAAFGKLDHFAST